MALLVTSQMNSLDVLAGLGKSVRHTCMTWTGVVNSHQFTDPTLDVSISTGVSDMSECCRVFDKKRAGQVDALLINVVLGLVTVQG